MSHSKNLKMYDGVKVMLDERFALTSTGKSIDDGLEHARLD